MSRFRKCVGLLRHIVSGVVKSVRDLLKFSIDWQLSVWAFCCQSPAVSVLSVNHNTGDAFLCRVSAVCSFVSCLGAF